MADAFLKRTAILNVAMLFNTITCIFKMADALHYIHVILLKSIRHLKYSNCLILFDNIQPHQSLRLHSHHPF